MYAFQPNNGPEAKNNEDAQMQAKKILVWKKIKVSLINIHVHSANIYGGGKSKILKGTK